MDVSSLELKGDVTQWDENEVHAWFTTLGYPQYGNQIREHRISGEVLCLMNAEDLKEAGISTIGQRLAILKAVYQRKLAQQIAIGPEDYIPPSEVEERQENVTVDRLHDLLREQENRLRSIEEDNRRLSETLMSCLEDINGLRSQAPRAASANPDGGLTTHAQRLLQNEAESPVGRAPSFKWASFVKSTRSPTKTIASETVVETPQSSPQRAEHDVASGSSRTSGHSEKPRSDSVSHAANGPSTASTSSSQPNNPKPSRQDSSDNLKSFKVSLDDPAWKVLPAALKKYKINNDDWQNYAMFICYGSPGNRVERCLSYDEKPLLLFQKLKDAKKNPVFMLKHIKDIRSPIAVAQQKHAALKASSETASVKSPPLTGASISSHGHSHQPSQDRSRPPKLQVNSHVNNSGTPGLLTAGPNAQSGWPEIMSPAVETKNGIEDQSQSNVSVSNSTDVTDSTAVSAVREKPNPNPAGISYAVAIYPYMAEQEDEFDVVVGDTFVILSRARGWWVVQHDPNANGIVDADETKQGWVPAGCLLETSVPVATAIVEATSKGASAGMVAANGSTPILPLNILSTSFPGIALMDYKKKGDEELDLAKDDTLRVFKRYNHWSYAVKEESGERGWVPSWFIGKLPPTGVAPNTPSTSSAHNNANASLSLDGDVSAGGPQPQVSPMSSAFPPIQTRAGAI